MISLVMVGVSHRSAPLEFLERLAYRPDQVRAGLGAVVQLTSVSEALLLSTCNRTEIYVAGDESACAQVAAVLAQDRTLPRPELEQHLATRRDVDVARHLFRVTAGLDSMIVGESEILGQVRAARATAHAAGSIGRELDDLFTWAIRTSRRVRRETDLGRAGRSIGSVAVDVASLVIGGLLGRRALVLGTGKVAGSVIKTLDDAGADQVVCGRSRERAEGLARSRDAAIAIGDLDREVVTADVVFCCTSADALLVTRSMLERAAGEKGELLVVDLSLPRNVDPRVEELPGVQLLTLADIGAHESHPGGQLLEAARIAEGIVAEGVARFGDRGRRTRLQGLRLKGSQEARAYWPRLWWLLRVATATGPRSQLVVQR